MTLTECAIDRFPLVSIQSARMIRLNGRDEERRDPLPSNFIAPANHIMTIRRPKLPVSYRPRPAISSVFVIIEEIAVGYCERPYCLRAALTRKSANLCASPTSGTLSLWQR